MISYLPPKNLLRHLRWGLVFCVALLSSCSIIGLRRQVEKLEAHGAVTIQVIPAPKASAPTYALAC